MYMNRKQKRKLIKIVSVICLSLFLMATGTISPICTANDTSTSVRLPLKQTFETATHKQFIYELVPIAKDNPMPANSKNGIYMTHLIGNQETQTEEIVYKEVGVYEYTIRPAEFNDTAGYEYNDKNVYHITVYVQKTMDGQLVPLVIAKNAENLKVDTLCFDYTTTKSDATDDPVKTGDSSEIEKWIVIFTASGILFVIFIFGKKRVFLITEPSC